MSHHPAPERPEHSSPSARRPFRLPAKSGQNRPCGHRNPAPAPAPAPEGPRPPGSASPDCGSAEALGVPGSVSSHRQPQPNPERQRAGRGGRGCGDQRGKETTPSGGGQHRPETTTRPTSRLALCAWPFAGTPAKPGHGPEPNQKPETSNREIRRPSVSRLTPTETFAARAQSNHRKPAAVFPPIASPLAASV
jgi:hypothetical protein